MLENNCNIQRCLWISNQVPQTLPLSVQEKRSLPDPSSLSAISQLLSKVNWVCMNTNFPGGVLVVVLSVAH